MSNTVVHCKREKFDVLIDRRTKWGNPFKIGPDGRREDVLDKYIYWIYAPGQTALREAAKRELKGKILGCWCRPQACHGDILSEIAND